MLIFAIIIAFVAGLVVGIPLRALNRINTRGETIRRIVPDASNRRQSNALPLAFSQRSELTGVTVEHREMFKPKSGIWLTRNGESVQLQFEDQERVVFPILIAKAAPVAFAVAHKPCLGHTDHYEFSRLIGVALPNVQDPLDSVKMEEIPIFQRADEKFWISKLESVSDDGTRLLVLRADVIASESDVLIDFHTYRFNRGNGQWTPILP